jgi:bifunctional DNA-binding transcriptional regulator/antitoxin component of YhaV-PrlF toxin-antitoxin module
LSVRTKLRAETTFRTKRRSDGTRTYANVPAEVRDYLGAGEGDRLIFEDGGPEALKRASLCDRFCIVRRATRPGEARQMGQVKLLKPAAETTPAGASLPEAEASSPAIEPFGAVVRRKQEERG